MIKFLKKTPQIRKLMMITKTIVISVWWLQQERLVIRLRNTERDHFLIVEIAKNELAQLIIVARLMIPLDVIKQNIL